MVHEWLRADRSRFPESHAFYPNDQAAAGLWYHDHALGITRLNLYADSKACISSVTDDEDDLNLPLPAPYEIPLMIQDRLLNPDGSLQYPVSDNSDPEVPPLWVPEFFGDTVLVNGKAWPYLDRRAQEVPISDPERLQRAVLSRHTQREPRERPTGQARSGPPFIQIGSDGGFLPVRSN